MALYEVAKKERSVEEAKQDLTSIVGIFTAKPELQNFLASPLVDREKKLDLVDKVFSDRARPITMKLLRLLIDKRRETELLAVREEFERIVEEAHGTLHVLITSAVPLDKGKLDQIVSRVAQQTGKDVIPEVEVDAKLIGGVQVEFGNSILDGSVSGALKRLRERLFIDVLKQA